MNERHDAIEFALRAPEPMLADENFSASVLARLPARRRRNAARRWTLAGSAALGSALTLAIAPPLEGVIASLAPFAVPPLAISAFTIVAIVLLPAAIVFYSERSGR